MNGKSAKEFFSCLHGTDEILTYPFFDNPLNWQAFVLVRLNFNRYTYDRARALLKSVANQQIWNFWSFFDVVQKYGHDHGR